MVESSNLPPVTECDHKDAYGSMIAEGRCIGCGRSDVKVASARMPPVPGPASNARSLRRQAAHTAMNEAINDIAETHSMSPTEIVAMMTSFTAYYSKALLFAVDQAVDQDVAQ